MFYSRLSQCEIYGKSTSVSCPYFSNKSLIFASSFFLPAVLTAAPLQVSRTGKDRALTGSAIFYFMIRLSSPFILTVCVYQHTELVLQAGADTGRTGSTRSINATISREMLEMYLG